MFPSGFFLASVSGSCQIPTAPQVGPWHSGRGTQQSGPLLGFGSPQEEKGADGQAPTGKAEQMAPRIMKIQLCSRLGRLRLEEEEEAGGVTKLHLKQLGPKEQLMQRGFLSGGRGTP